LAQFAFGVSSHNDYVTTLRQLFDYAVHDGCITKNPCTYLKYLRREDPIRRTPSVEQFKAIVADVRPQEFNGHGADQSADFLEFLGCAGLGQAEAAAITRADVEFPANQSWVYRRKTSTRFPVPIFPWLRPLLERLCEGKAHDDHLFNMANGKKALAGACKRLGYPPFSQRSLRRMFITNAIQKGVDIRLIAQWQGHRDNGELILRTYGRKIDDPHHQRMAQLITEEVPGNVVSMMAAQS
jgi:integrase